MLLNSTKFLVNNTITTTRTVHVAIHWLYTKLLLDFFFLCLASFYLYTIILVFFIFTLCFALMFHNLIFDRKEIIYTFLLQSAFSIPDVFYA